jgi:hypothetical protein
MFTSTQVMVLITLGAASLLAVTLVAIIVPAWASVCKLRLETPLKQQMLERGMSAEEIVKVLHGLVRDDGSRDQTGSDYPFACEVVVERDEEWHTGLLLRRDGERFLVHYVGEDMSENEWVTQDRLRIRPDAKMPDGSPWDGAFLTQGFHSNSWCANHSKPAHEDAEV